MMARAPVLTLALFCTAFRCVPVRADRGGVSLQEAPEISRIHRQKCGRCHAPPEPRTRTRDHLDSAFLRHKSRVRLTAEQWAAMGDYLAVPNAAGESNAH
ncbi:MAG: hypothetical protein M3O50_00620 [Myxococcota bacterium]|nr:hypothetical protein [Myxococcota bacterium]